LIQDIVVIFRKCWDLPRHVTDDDLKDSAAPVLKCIKGGKFERAPFMEVAKIQLTLGQPRNQSHKEVAALAIEMVD
jgi:hypothetical protein